jgi:hypothetical protein
VNSPVSERTVPARTSFFAPALVAVRRNLLPGLVLQGTALALVTAYFTSPALQTALDHIGTLKREFGFAFSAFSTALFGGLLPFLVLLLTRQLPPGKRRAELLFYVTFWAWKGMEIDAFYRLQGFWFGEDASVATIATKALVDQGVYNVLWAAPSQTLFFLWKDSGFSLAELKRRLRAESLWRRLGLVLVSTWVVWLPTVAIVYALPAPLQIPLFNLVLCFWCLLLSFISSASK